MRRWIAFWNIVRKDLKIYYLKPPNLSWGLLFPLAWTAIFFIKSGRSWEEVSTLLPGIISLAILFGTTSMLAVTITFEKRTRAFERLLVAPLELGLLMLAKLGGAVLFGIANSFLPLLIALFLVDLSAISWTTFLLSVLLISLSSALLGFFVAVSVTEVFEAQTFSNFFRFPMVFLCGLFFPVQDLPWFLKPLSYALPLTYGADALRHSVGLEGAFSLGLDLSLLVLASVLLFALSLRTMKRRWIL